MKKIQNNIFSVKLSPLFSINYVQIVRYPDNHHNRKVHQLTIKVCHQDVMGL